MRTRQVAVAVVLVVVGVALSAAANGRAQAIDEAGDAADLVVSAQLIRAELGRADAAAINAFLAPGAEDPDQRRRYDQAVTNAGLSLLDATRAAARETGSGSPAAEPLAALSRLLPTYTGLVETARAEDRQNLPVGAAYLRQASELARGDAGVEIEAMRVAGDETFRSLDDDVTGGFGALLWVAMLVAVVVVVSTQRWFAARTRRRLNIGMVGGVAVLAVGLLWAAQSFGSSARSARTALSGGYDTIAALSAIRSDAFDEKAQATFALVDRGARATYGAASDTAANNVTARLDALAQPGTLISAWDDYRQASVEVRSLDDDGRYEDARIAITAPVEDAGSLNATFETFDAELVERIDAARAALVDGLDRARAPMSRMLVVGLLTGLVAAALAAAGLQQRIGEYR